MAQLDLVGIKESIRSNLASQNTTTGSPVDLSANMVIRVTTILKVNPELIPIQASFFPLATCFIESKSVRSATIAQTQLAAKRRAEISMKIVGMVWNPTMVNINADPPAEDLHYLMENIEEILRNYTTLDSKILWQMPDAVTYHTAQIDEETHMRAGIMSLIGTVLY